MFRKLEENPRALSTHLVVLEPRLNFGDTARLKRFVFKVSVAWLALQINKFQKMATNVPQEAPLFWACWPVFCAHKHSPDSWKKPMTDVLLTQQFASFKMKSFLPPPFFIGLCLKSLEKHYVEKVFQSRFRNEEEPYTTNGTPTF